MKIAPSTPSAGMAVGGANPFIYFMADCGGHPTGSSHAAPRISRFWLIPAAARGGNAVSGVGPKALDLSHDADPLAGSPFIQFDSCRCSTTARHQITLNIRNARRDLSP